jgi:hypothetical protein
MNLYTPEFSLGYNRSDKDLNPLRDTPSVDYEKLPSSGIKQKISPLPLSNLTANSIPIGDDHTKQLDDRAYRYHTPVRNKFPDLPIYDNNRH